MKKKNDNEKRIDPEFRKDDWVLMYEPPVTHKTAARQWNVPKKFQDTLTGPHRILNAEPNEKGEILVLHTRRKKNEYIHVSRLVKYSPWSDDILDTAQGSLVPGNDIRHNKQPHEQQEEKNNQEVSAHKDGDQVQFGDLAAILFEDEDKFPIVVIQVQQLGSLREGVTKDNNRYRMMDGVILGNASQNPEGVYRNGWIDPKDNKHYFKKNKLRTNHRPLMLSDLNTKEEFSTYYNIYSGFTLTPGEKLDKQTLIRFSQLLEEYNVDQTRFDLPTH